MRYAASSAILISRVAPSSDVQGAVHELVSGAMHSINLEMGLTVSCTRGMLWLTSDHCSDDVVLERGDAYVAAQSGGVTIVALRQAAYRVMGALPGLDKATKRTKGHIRSLRQFLRSSRVRVVAPSMR